ncbi:MAG: CRISPR-associated endonuclease Cas3'', partial [Longimicrobiales bacterium]
MIVNRVGRAQDVYRRLRDRLARDSGKTEVLLVHARFRAAERAALNARVRVVRPDDNIVIVATQAVEAGVDITSRHLFTELAPWSSLVQRFGRCNRGGEYADAMVHWLDIETDADAQLALPYDAAAMNEARGRLGTLDSAASAHLPPVTERPDTPHVLRRKDLLDLFNTEPDLSGFDIDISPYLRDPGGAQVQIFWRAFGVQPEGQKRPDRSELCPAPIGAAREHLKATKRRAHVWNTLAARWEGIDQADIRPGQTLLVQADAGGYSSELGFVAASKERVEPVALAEETAAADPDSMDAAAETVAADFVELAGHLLEAKRQAESLAEKLPMAGAGDEVVTAALWHDIGKSHPAFQTALLADAGDDVDRSTLWAKSPDARRQLKYSVVIDGQVQSRRHFRHELASMLAWLEVGAGASSASLTRVGAETPNASRGDDLVAYLIAAHHGKVRMALRSLPNETRPEDNRLFARGIWAGDELPSLAVNGLRLPAITLRLDVMQLGVGEMGPSWSARTAGLLAHWGPFRLAWLESMVRLADWRASAVV